MTDIERRIRIAFARTAVYDTRNRGSYICIDLSR